jgi:hypothetical protein
MMAILRLAMVWRSPEKSGYKTEAGAVCQGHLYDFF